MTLDQFLKDNRDELIRRTRTKVASRSSPPSTDAELEHGVPLFLSQLSTTLQDQGLNGGTGDSTRASKAAHPAIGESAAKHGRQLRTLGFTIDQVVHDYGDICQAVTELVEERGANMSVAEFHTLNRCLDNAIAGAVSSWSEEDSKRTVQAANSASRDLQRLIDQAKTALDVIRGGRVSVGGATGTLLHRSLAELSALVDKTLKAR